MKIRPGWTKCRYPEAPEQYWAPPNTTLQFKAVKGCRTPTVLQFSSPPKKPYTWQSNLLNMFLLWQKAQIFSAFCPYSHILLLLCTHDEHLCSSCPPYFQMQVSAKALFAELYWLLLPQLALYMFTLMVAFLDNKAVLRIFWDNGLSDKWGPWSDFMWCRSMHV